MEICNVQINERRYGSGGSWSSLVCTVRKREIEVHKRTSGSMIKYGRLCYCTCAVCAYACVWEEEREREREGVCEGLRKDWKRFMHGFVYNIDLAKIAKVKKDSRSTKFFLGKKETYKDVCSINVCGIPTEVRVRQSKCMERRMKKAKKAT